MGDGDDVWPNFFIVGPPKAGTTTVHEWIGHHPDVFTSRSKEIHYFAPSVTWPQYEADRPVRGHRDPRRYASNFRDGAGCAAVGEASTSYLIDPGAADRIAAEVPGARAITILRDPIARAYSHFLMHRRNHVQSRTFHECVLDELTTTARRPVRDYVAMGMYHTHVARFVEALGRENVLALDFTTLVEEPRRLLQDIFEFLGVDTEPASTIPVDRVHNPFVGPRGPFSELLLRSRWFDSVRGSPLPGWIASFVRRRVLTTDRKPAMPEAVRWILADHYDEEIEAVEKLLGREFPGLRASFPDEYGRWADG